MPRRGAGKIVIHFPQAFYIFINGKDYTNYILGYEFKKQLSQMSTFRVRLAAIGTTEQTDVAEGNVVQLRLANKLLFKGIIEKADYKSYEDCNIDGYGAAETYMTKTTVGWISGVNGPVAIGSAEGRPIYEGTTSGVSSADIVSGQMIEVGNAYAGTNDYLGHVIARSDNDNIMSFLDGMVRNLSGVWWTSYGASGVDLYPFELNYFNVSTSKGTGAVSETFNLSGDNQNADSSSRQVDEESLVNSVIALGYGDGANQLRSKAFHATDNFTRLDINATSTATTLSVEDASVLPASGTVWVGMEQVAYTGQSGNDLTGCTRAEADGLDSNNYGYLKKYAHSKGALVYDVTYTEDSTDGNSKIDDYGLKRITITDKEIVSQDALDLFVANYLIYYYEPAERITLAPSDIYETLSGVSVGDTVNVTDTESGLSGDYTVVGETVSANEIDERLSYELNNSRASLTEDMSESAQAVRVGSQFMQGSTTAFNVQSYENCDATNPLHIRVYLPADIIKVNKAQLNFKVKDYRAYTTTTAGGASHSHALTGTTSNSGDTGEPVNSYAKIFDEANGGQPTIDTNANPSSFNVQVPSIVKGTFDGCIATVEILNMSGAEDDYSFTIKKGETTLTTEADQTIAAGDAGTGNYTYSTTDVSELNILTLQLTDGIIGTASGQAFDGYVHFSIQSTAKHTHAFAGETTDTESTHTHGQSYAINVSAAGSDAAVDVDIGADGGSLGRVRTDETSTSNIDVSSWIVSGITLADGNWMDIQLTPNKVCRVEANVFLKCFIQAK